MPELNPDDVKRISTKLLDGRRHICYIHEPTGIRVEAYADDEPVCRVNERLMAELRDKVAQPGG